MQMRALAALLIFLGSYFPLSLILLVQDVNYALVANGSWCNVFSWKASCVLPVGHPLVAIAMLSICFASLCLTLVALSAVSPKTPIHITEVRYVPAELMGYTLPYVVSFMSIGYQDTGKFSGFIVFLAWMFWITHKSGQIFLNPVLTVFGWRLYEIKYNYLCDTSVKTGRALARCDIEPMQNYAHDVIQDVIILRTDRP